MTTDHGDSPHGGQSELWSLREDVQLQLPADGSVRLQSRWGSVTIQQPTAVVREALRRMLLGPISLENVTSAPHGPSERRAAAESLTLLHSVLDRMQPFIIRTLGIESGQPLLSVVPLTPRARFRPVPLPAHVRVRLSTFAQLRTDGNEYRLESPLSLYRVLLHRPEAMSLLSSLSRPTAVASVTARPHPDALAADAVAYLAAIGMVVLEREAGDEPDITEEASVAGWSAADLMFHTRSNSGRHDNPVGRTYPMGEDGSPEPVVRLRADPGIPLHRPTWESLSADDPPLGLVMEGRRSTRSYSAEPVTAEELGDLLYRTARIRAIITPPGAGPEPDAGERDPRLSDRPYPGGGACYELELYITAVRCPGIPPGVYRYDPLRHSLQLTNADREVADQLLLHATEAAGMVTPPPVLITMTARFRRVSWKYAGIAYSTVLKDVGVLLQNLYLVCTAMGLAPCAIGSANLDLTARAFGTDWQLEPSVGQFVLGRAPGSSPEYAWRWQPVNDADWADNARALLCER